MTVGSFDSKDDPRIVATQNLFGAKVTAGACRRIADDRGRGVSRFRERCPSGGENGENVDLRSVSRGDRRPPVSDTTPVLIVDTVPGPPGTLSDMNAPDPLRLVVASRNRKKSAKSATCWPFTGLSRRHRRFPDVPDVVEDGHTFAENAAKKASGAGPSLIGLGAGRRQRTGSRRAGRCSGHLLGPLQRSGRDRRIEQRQTDAGAGGRPRRAADRPLRLQRRRRLIPRGRFACRSKPIATGGSRARPAAQTASATIRTF